MDWLALSLAVVKFGLAIFRWLGDRAKEKIGEDREKLRQFTALAEISATLKTVDERFDRMSDDEVKEEITKQGDWRD